MARRDKTQEYMGYRARNRRMGQQQDGSFQLALAPAWMENVHDIEYDIQKLENKMSELSSLHKRHLLPQFSASGGYEQDEKKEIDILTAEITRQYQNSYFKIKKIGEGDNLTSEELAMRRNIQSSLATKLQDLSVTFKQSQRDFLMKLSGQETAEDDPFHMNVNTEDFHDPGFSEDLLSILETNITETSLREEEMKKLLDSVRDLNSIFKDISILIIEQGSILDRIDYNIENAEHHVFEAERELEKANEIVKKSKSKLCMIAIGLAVLVMLVILLMKIVVVGLKMLSPV